MRCIRAALEQGELAALVSALPSADVRARRSDLLRHAEVLQHAFEQHTVVPLEFGTLFASDDDVVAELLEPRYEDLVALLQRLDGLVELTVRAFYDENRVLAAIVRDDPRSLRCAAGAPRPSRLGEAVAEALAAAGPVTRTRSLRSCPPSRTRRSSKSASPNSRSSELRSSSAVRRRRIGRAGRGRRAVRRRDPLQAHRAAAAHHFVSEQWAS